MNHLNNQRGMTRTLMIVIGVVVILGGIIVLPKLLQNNNKEYDAKRSSDLKQIQSTINMYYSDHHYYPPSGNGVCVATRDDCLGEALAGGTTPYTSKLPTPPPGSAAYKYEASPNGCTLGACVGYTLSVRMSTGIQISLHD